MPGNRSGDLTSENICVCIDIHLYGACICHVILLPQIASLCFAMVSNRPRFALSFAVCHLQRMRQSGIYVSTTESLVFQLLGDATHPKFKQVQKLIVTPLHNFTNLIFNHCLKDFQITKRILSGFCSIMCTLCIQGPLAIRLVSERERRERERERRERERERGERGERRRGKMRG